MNKTEISADMSYLVENIFVYFLQLVYQGSSQGGSWGACDPLKAYLHGTTLSHATSLRQAYDMT